MIKLLRLNKLRIIFIFLALLIPAVVFATEPADIWENKKKQDQQVDEVEKISIESSMLSDNKDKIEIDEDQIEKSSETVIGIFDPEEHNFNLNMWSQTDGEDIKKILKRINKIRLSKSSEDLLFKVLFTNAYPPKKNLSKEEFLKIKIGWLIKKKRIKDLETLLKNNPEVGENSKAIKFLINEYLSSADIKSACDNINFIDQKVQNDYLDKFIIYCLINNDRKDEAQIIFDLLK